ncbi:serine/threonine-protein kinase [Laspinema olomoucense]|uniref:serine/threonine-protein kinase n=1 Tax=Laspinema olomoucense TaxID=3231600 RepID=UPI0021BA69EF|nr:MULTISPECIES: serine/threonine-protein kinase [unclassified Laspinema]MCT7973705.1 serine/threonine protein kinase [Laspinema sp. D3d]MCT7996596.1 serine/threonine protein kinase [Laspinema sp. D3c]
MLGKTLAGHYKIVKNLSSGGFGETYIAEDTHRPGNPKCVVKHLKPVNSSSAVLPIARRLFNSEAQVLEKLGEHPRIPRLLAYFEEDEEFYLVQEFIDGHPLSAELPLGQRWSENQVKTMLEDVLGILEFVHAQGVIHRDIKPDNIMRRESDNKLVLIDFGAIKEVGNQGIPQTAQASSTVAIGTPGYMPTEQGRGKPRPSSDLYALGMIAIQSLTGMLPNQLREDDDTGEISWKDQANVSPELAMILSQMIRYHFKDRYKTATEVLIDMKSLGGGEIHQSTPPANQKYQAKGGENHSILPPKNVPSNQGYAVPTTPVLPSSPQTISHPKLQNNRVIWTGIATVIFFFGGALMVSLYASLQNPGNSVSDINPSSGYPSPSSDSSTPPALSPDKFVFQYYHNLNSSNYEKSWKMLSYRLKNDYNSHPNGYDSYLEWWTKVANVNVLDSRIIYETAAIVKVQSNLEYYLISGRTLQQVLIFSLVFDENNSSWYLDKVDRIGD